MFCVVGVFPPLSFHGMRTGLGPLPLFARTLGSGATVRSPNYDLRGSSVTCASHGGTMERLARMVQRSLDCANNGFYGLSVHKGQYGEYGDTGDTVILRCSLTQSNTVRSLRSGVTARRFWRQRLPQACPSECNGHRRGGRTTREESRERRPLASSPRTHRLPFFVCVFLFLVAIAPGFGPFRAAPLVRRPSLRNTPQLPVDGPTLFDPS